MESQSTTPRDKWWNHMPGDGRPLPNTVEWLNVVVSCCFAPKGAQIVIKQPQYITSYILLCGSLVDLRKIGLYGFLWVSLL
jgi:hypothetical protein